MNRPAVVRTALVNELAGMTVKKQIAMLETSWNKNKAVFTAEQICATLYGAMAGPTACAFVDVGDLYAYRDVSD